MMYDNLSKTILAGAVAATALLTLTACGYSTGDRAVSGAGIGAGVGAVTGALTGGNAGTGALIGGAIGGVGGAVTDPNKINLGRPAWE